MRRLILGKHPTADRYGLWLSRRGNDAAGPDDGLLLSSDREYMNIYLRGSFELYPRDGLLVGSVTFNLPYTPIFIANAFQKGGRYTSTTPLMGLRGENVWFFVGPTFLECQGAGNLTRPLYCNYTIFANQLF